MGLQIVHMVIASILLAAVLVCVVLRPRGLNVAWSASVAALIAIAEGLVPLTALRTIFNDTWDASVTLIALFFSLRLAFWLMPPARSSSPAI